MIVEVSLASLLADHLRELYTFFTDAEDITEESTVIFLRQLQQALSDSEDDRLAAFGNATSSLLSPEVIDVFIGVARDILSYFRQCQSTVLLGLLREISDSVSEGRRGRLPPSLRLTAALLLGQGSCCC
jgi:hypothetical protein